MKHYLLTGLLAAAVAIAGCARESDLPKPTGEGDVRAINAIPTSPNISFLIEEQGGRTGRPLGNGIERIPVSNLLAGLRVVARIGLVACRRDGFLLRCRGIGRGIGWQPSGGVARRVRGAIVFAAHPKEQGRGYLVLRIEP